MNRRQFLKRAGIVGGLGLAGWSLWPQAGMLNPCRAGLPPELAQHPLMQQVWAGLDPAKVWDVHAHLVGVGDSDSRRLGQPEDGQPVEPAAIHPEDFLHERRLRA